MTALTHRYLSLGAGVQSSTLLLLAAHGRIPRFDAAIFADTRWEPSAVYGHLNRLTGIAERAGIEVVRVSTGDIRADALDPAHRFASMPLFTLGPRGERGMARRQCCVICTIYPSLVTVFLPVIKEFGVDLRSLLVEGRCGLPNVGSLALSDRVHPPVVVVDAAGVEIEPITAYLRDLAIGDCSPLTCRSYGFGLLRWFRLLWLLEVAWEKATETEVAVLAAWLRASDNPQRRRTAGDASEPGAVNPRTGKASLRRGYAPRTINHALSVVSGFYTYHAHFGQGPVVNPVPAAAQRRRALAHRSPLEVTRQHRRARLRQRVPDQPPRSIPDTLWDELFAAMSCDRDRALMEFFVSSGARAAELLGVTLADIDWAGQRIWVISKGTRLRQVIPASPQAFLYLVSYLHEHGIPPADEPVWRTRRGRVQPLTYSALRRILQRANQRLGTNWTLHDLRHTAAARMANGGKLTLTEVQSILRHADIRVTGRYLVTRVEELFDKLAEHYSQPRPQTTYSPGYDPADVQVVFGA
ncbi:site-specific integrase [Plantactinospora sp. KLBMP9567]|uniref:tyrosine-type recombinase/integrase n=1 Tax=Plantactinospora sp. KLBMP9567 TaxID=3085900 RepID=UPI002982AF25|nr:site-specific integrase [Plantactinospora sp. KLBMP9567]MDW5327147.1 site-specific integrase [Plantactinospora sp. KLBMP9567]